MPDRKGGPLRVKALPYGRASDTKRLIMIETISIQDLRTSYDDLKTRVEQLGRFL